MKKHTLIALALTAAVALPLAAASRSSKKTSAPKTTLMAAVPAEVTEVADAKEVTRPSAEVPTAPTQVQSTAAADKTTSKAAQSRSVTDAPKTARVPAEQSRARQLIADLTTAQKSKLLTFLNEASVRELAAVQGISTTRGAAIERARPFEGIDEVVLVKGIGEGTFAEIVKHGKTLTLARTASTDDKKASAARKSS